jgi:formylglycine-generating enzyme
MGFSESELELVNRLDVALSDREHEVSISGFFLDRFEISVGRFLTFARAYRGPPAAGAGEHPHVAGSGWQADWDESLPADAAKLLRDTSCGGANDPLAALARLPALAAGSAVSADAGSIDRAVQTLLLPELPPLDNLDHPMECLSWFVAFAFCIWDGGRLPTDAEWEYAAAGGAENRSYPWGEAVSVLDELKMDTTTAVAVGSRPATRGSFGHDDLAGGVLEWVFDAFDEDYYREAGASCQDCANLSNDFEFGRGLRGAKDPTCCAGLDTTFRAASRSYAADGLETARHGARCARAAEEGPGGADARDR